MKDQELREILHGYRPKMDDDEAFMDKLMAQMDAADKERRQPRIIPLYRRVVPWVAAIAAAVVVAMLVIKDPATPPAENGYRSSLPEHFYMAPSPIPGQGSPARSLSDFSSYEDIVSDIERSGRQLEYAIAQL